MRSAVGGAAYTAVLLRTVRLEVVFGALLAQHWRQPVVIDNRPGDSGVVALSEVKRASADGHELFLGDAGALAVMPWLYRRPPYEPARDFVPVSTLFRATMVLWTGAGSRYGTAADLLAAARARQREVSFASLGPGSPTHLPELIRADTDRYRPLVRSGGIRID